MPLVGLTREESAKLPVISIGDGDHRVNKSTVSVIVRKLGGLAEAYDNAEGFPHQDCTRPEVGDPVLRKLRAGKARGLHVAIECSSFSPIAEQVRSMADFPSQVRGMPGLNESQQRRVDVGNEFADFCVESLWSAFKGAVSWTAEFQAWRGDTTEPEPTRLLWLEKADYPTLMHFPRMQALLEASGAEVFIL